MKSYLWTKGFRLGIWRFTFIVVLTLAYSGSKLFESNAAAPQFKAKTQKHSNETDDHDAHGEGEKHDDHGEGEKHDDHGEGEKHDDHDEEEAPKNVGPNKGLTSFDEKNGFSLSPEAYKTFAIEVQALSDAAPWVVPASSIVSVNAEKSVFRFRDGKFKRVRVTTVKLEKTKAQIQASELRTKDQIVIRGGGFLRVAELDATSGESGHHH